MKKAVVVVALLVAAAWWLVRSGGEITAKEEAAKAAYLAQHPLTAIQVDANKHFLTCYKYRDMSSNVWSDKQKATALALEGCQSDDRDDLRYKDATDPWNADAPQPWKTEPAQQFAPEAKFDAGPRITPEDQQRLNELMQQKEQDGQLGTTPPAANH